MEFKEFLDKKLLRATDSIIRNIEINLTKKTVTVEFSTDGPDEWSNIKIKLKNMLEYQVKLRKNYGIDVMSGGIEYDIYDGVHYLNFDVYSCKGTGIDRYRSSYVYFGCKEVIYKLKEYSE